MTRQPIYLLSTGILSERLVKEAAERGVVLDGMSFIAIEYMDTKTLIPEIAVFTSVNAVDAVGRWVHEKPDWKVYCISGATYEAVVRLFGENSVVGKAASAAELAALIRHREVAKREEIVFFCGDQRRDELPSLGVTEKVVYRTVLTPHKAERNYDGIAFFSPSAVESFFSVNVVAGEIPLVCHWPDDCGGHTCPMYKSGDHRGGTG